MAQAASAPEPQGILYRIGRYPDPLGWPEPAFRRKREPGRFHDPEREYGVLYAAELLVTCYEEILAPLRPSLEAIAIMRQRGIVPPNPPFPLDGAWLDRHLCGSFNLAPGRRWLDYRTAQTFTAIRTELGTELQSLGYGTFDAEQALSCDRQATMRISRWAYASGYDGVVYLSHIEPTHVCWALFERPIVR